MLVYGYEEADRIMWELAGEAGETPTDALLAFVVEEARSDEEAFRMAMAIPLTAVLDSDDSWLADMEALAA
jgi:hypothetical protein